MALWRRLFIAVGAAALAACGSAAPLAFAPPGNATRLAPAVAPVYIKHVVIVIQENRSFDNLFATYPGADGTTVGKKPHGTVNLTKVPLYDRREPFNNYGTFLSDYDHGKMDGFWNTPVSSGYPGSFVYQYVDPTQITPYWDMASRYVLADHLFQTQGSGSFTGHQDLIRGDTAINRNEALVDNPDSLVWGCDAARGTKIALLKLSGVYVPRALYPCLRYPTLRDTLDAKGVSWRYYAPAIETGGSDAQDLWSAFAAIKAVYRGTEWRTNVSSPETNIFGDISKGKLAEMSWIVPDFDNSDHPGADSDTGPSWVASIVNAIGKSQYWDSTAVIVVWDDWGGFYDHVAPPKLPHTVANLGGPGFRVPMIVVSPYAKKGYVSHKTYGFGSIVRFVEIVFGLPSLNTTDATSAGFVDDFFSFGKPRKFTPISTKYSREFFLHQPPSNKPVDTN